MLDDDTRKAWGIDLLDPDAEYSYAAVLEFSDYGFIFGSLVTRAWFDDWQESLENDHQHENDCQSNESNEGFCTDCGDMMI